VCGNAGAVLPLIVQRLDHKPALQIDSLVHRYHRDQQPILSIEELSLDPGEQLVLTGSSGSGKSSLLNLVAGLMNPSAGSIEIRGTKINELHGHARDRFRGQNIGMVFQTHHLLSGFSAQENVMAALMFSDVPRGSHRARARTLLDSLGIPTPTQRIDKLSIGQQQRVAIARALVCDPALVLADEPTASLDPENADVALNLLQDACRSSGAALLCVTHDRRFIDRFDRAEHLQSAHEQLQAAAGSA
jgi:putative ABC transport system ATP-binding protein